MCTSILSFLMDALWNRAGHYIFILWFFFYLSSFFLFPHLISAVGHWMSTILLHMVWPYCEFRMHVWNLLHTACWKCRMQKSPSGHHPTTLLAYIFTTKARIANQKKPLKQQYLPHRSLQYGELRRTSGWGRFINLGHPCKFQWVSHLGSVAAQHSSIGH